MDGNFSQWCEKSSDKSSVWQYFLRDQKNGLGKCNICKKILKATGGSTKGLRDHVRIIHNIDVNLKSNIEEEKCSEAPSKSKVQKLTNFFSSKNSLEIVVSRLVALDGLSFSVIVTSKDIRNGLAAQGFTNIPTSVNGVKSAVMKYAETVRKQQLNIIKCHLRDGKRFSVIFDEWSSMRNRRYLNIFLRSSSTDMWNLGLVRIFGSAPAEVLLNLVAKRLQNYELRIDENIVCLVTDGTSTMRKIGRISGSEHQLCLAHGIQLAVMEVLYLPTCKATVNERKVHLELDLNNEEENSEDEDLTDSMLFYGYDDNDLPLAEVPQFISSNLRRVIDKIRKIVKIFKRSPTKNDSLLQKYVIAAFGMEYQLLLDSRVRWNSLYDMMERFIKLKDCVLKSLIDLKSSITFSEEEVTMLEQTVAVLEPVKATVLALCRADCNLLVADTLLNFALQKLDTLGTTMAKELAISLRTKIKERRTDLSGLLFYLHTARVTNQDKDVIFNIPPVCRLQDLIFSLITRLKGIESTSDIMDQNNGRGDDDVEILHDSRSGTKSNTIEAEINDMIKSVMSSVPSSTTKQTPDSLKECIKKEMHLLEANGTRGQNLERVYKYLLSIPPTSVDCERAFSSAGILCTKIRSRLNDSTLDSLCLLRSYFQNERRK